MEQRRIRFEQFYYTNYHQGMRFEGASVNDRQTQEEVKNLAPVWMKLDTQKPVESILYNPRLGSYMAAMIVPCTRPGDQRISYWIHAALPVTKESDGFMECLSWPLESYETRVREKRALDGEEFPEKSCDLRALVEKYRLSGDRMIELIYKVWKTICDNSVQSTLTFIVGEDQSRNCNALAREVMAIVYNLLPKERRMEVSYQAWSINDIDYTHFVFKSTTDSGWYFDLEAEEAEGIDEMTTEEREVFEGLAESFWKDLDQFQADVEIIYPKKAISFEDIIWQSYKDYVASGQDVFLTQERLIHFEAYIRQCIKNNPGSQKDIIADCWCLRQMDIRDKSLKYIQTLTDRYISTVVQIQDTNNPEYEKSFERSLILLKTLAAFNKDQENKVYSMYMNWIREQSESYYAGLKYLYEKGTSMPERSAVFTVEKNAGLPKNAAMVADESESIAEKVPVMAESPEKKKRKKRRQAGEGDEEENLLVPLLLSACVGLYIGLMVDGWHMAVNLCKLIELPALVWIAIVSMAVVNVVAFILVSAIIHKPVVIDLRHIPVAGGWVFLNLVFANFAGNKITAMITIILLAGVAIWLRAKKYL